MIKMIKLLCVFSLFVCNALAHAANPQAELKRAIELRMQNQFAAAEPILIDLATGAEAGEPESVMLIRAKAARLLGEADPAWVRQALDHYQTALQDYPESRDTKLALAELLLDKYNNTEALPLIREVLAADPANVNALLLMARSQQFDHNPGAVATVRRALALEPEFVPARLLLARLLLEADRRKQAKTEIDRVLQLDAENLDALSLEAAMHLLNNDAAELEENLQYIRKLAPGYLDLYITLAEIAAQNRLYGRAMSFAREAVQLQPAVARARALYGMNQYRLGQVNAARKNLELAFKADPYDVWLKNTLELLDATRDNELIHKGRFILSSNRRDALLLAPELFRIAERAFDTFAERYDYAPPTPIRIEFYKDRDDFSVRTVGLVGVDILGVSFGPTVALVSSEALRGGVNMGSVLHHELAHTFHLGLSASRVPRWLTEGLSVLEEHRGNPGWGMDVDGEFLKAFVDGKLPPASELNRAFTQPSYPEQVLHAYFMGFLLVEYIETDYGIEVIRNFLVDYGKGLDTPTVLQQNLDISLERLDRDLDAHVRTRYAHIIEATGLGATPPDEKNYLRLKFGGEQAFETEQYDKAKKLFQRARDLVPEFAGANSPYHRLAEIALLENDRPAAVGHLRKLIEINADDFESHQKLAQLYAGQGQIDAAVETYTQALLIHHHDRESRDELASLLEELGDMDRTVTQRRAVLELGPSDRPAAHYHLARTLLADGDPEQAREQVLLSLENAPLFDDALQLLLDIRRQQGHSDRLEDSESVSTIEEEVSND